MGEILAKLLGIGIIVSVLYLIALLFDTLAKLKPDKVKTNESPIRVTNSYKTSSPGRSSTDFESRRLYSLVDELTEVFKIKEPFNGRSIRQYFNSRNFAGCVSEMKKQMGLNNRILLRCYSDDKYPRDNSYGFIDIPANIPLINTPAFNNFKMVISIKESTKTSYETFIYTLAHELSHAVLHSIRHSLKESEEATDLLVIIMGFGDIMEKGIKDERKAGHYASDGFTRFNSNHSTICGYLGETNFKFVKKYIYDQHSKIE